MHVDEHLYMIVNPGKEALAAGCETLVFHATDANFHFAL